MVEKIAQISKTIIKMNFRKLKFQNIFLKDASRIPNLKYFSKCTFKTTKLAKFAVLLPRKYFFKDFIINFNSEFLFKQGY